MAVSARPTNRTAAPTAAAIGQRTATPTAAASAASTSRATPQLGESCRSAPEPILGRNLGFGSRGRRGAPSVVRRVASTTPQSITTKLVNPASTSAYATPSTPHRDMQSGSAGANVTSDTISAAVPSVGIPKPSGTIREDPASGDEQRAHQEDPHQRRGVLERVAEEERHEHAGGELERDHHPRQAATVMEKNRQSFRVASEGSLTEATCG